MATPKPGWHGQLVARESQVTPRSSVSVSRQGARYGAATGDDDDTTSDDDSTTGDDDVTGDDDTTGGDDDDDSAGDDDSAR
jgi:hypothetical protein